VQSAISKLASERAEVNSILSAGVFGRTNNLGRLLTFVCDKYFEGAIDEIKEYSIAVNALGRPDSFDPQVDTIVRVTAHALRKRLEDYYRGAGAAHAVHICLPPGHYVPKFIHTSDLETARGESTPDAKRNGQTLHGPSAHENGRAENNLKNTLEPPHDQRAFRVAEDQLADESKAKFRPGATIPLRAILFALSVLVLSVIVWEKWNRKTGGESSPQTVVAAAPVYTPGKILRAMVGSPAPYLDHGGFTWDSDHFCSGGSSFSISGHTIQGTEDSLLFSGGRRGIFHCSYPVSPGTYEVHLLFAETSGLQEASRNVTFSVNGGPPSSLDVVDDAGGDDIATTKVFTDVAPASDGSIHLDFTTSEASSTRWKFFRVLPTACFPSESSSGISPTAIPKATFGCQTVTFSAAALAVLEVIYPK